MSNGVLLKYLVKGGNKITAGPIPYLLITNGSTGSGKTIMVSKTVAHLQLNPDHTKLLIDDLVEQNDTYKVETTKIIQGVKEQCKKTGQDVDNIYTHADKDLQKQFEHAYFMARRDVQCERGCCGVTCSNLLNQRIAGAISSHKNIVFETTGLSKIDWLFDSMIKDEKYYVISAYTLVNVNLLADRMTQRTLTSIRSFEHNVQNPAPRLPDLNFEHIKANQTKVIDNLVDAISKLKGKRQDPVPQSGINRILVYDNSGTEMKIIYDSDVSTENTPEGLRSLFVRVTG